MRNRAVCLATFGTASAIDANWIGIVAIGAVYRTITSDRRVHDYVLHGVLRVLFCGINGTQDLVVQLTGKAPATVARTMLQPVLDEARLAGTCTRASLNNDNGHEITTRTQTIAACGQGACRDALESLPWVLGQIRGCTPVTFV